MLTRNQLPSIVGERTEAEATVMEQGVNLLANFPLPSPFIFFLTTEICGNFLKYCCPTGNIRETS